MSKAVAITHPFNHWQGNGAATHAYPNCLVELDFHEGSGTITADALDLGTHVAALTDAPDWVTGMQGSGYYATSLNGSSEYVNLGTKVDWNLAADLTVAMWVKPKTLGGYDTFAGKITGAADNWRSGGWALYWETDNVHFFVSDYIDSGAVAGTLTADGEWHQLVGTFNKATGAVQVYVDGEAGTTGACTKEVLYDSNPLCLGFDATSSKYYFDGCIDKFAYYAKCLTATEVTTLYNWEKV